MKASFKWIMFAMYVFCAELIILGGVILYGVYDLNNTINTRADQVTTNINYNVNKTMELMDSMDNDMKDMHKDAKSSIKSADHIIRSMDKSIIILQEKKK